MTCTYKYLVIYGTTSFVNKNRTFSKFILFGTFGRERMNSTFSEIYPVELCVRDTKCSWDNERLESYLGELYKLILNDFMLESG